VLKKLLATSALCSIPLVAGAADLPVKAPVYKAPVVAPFSWTGFYGGANLGYSWGHSDVSFPDAPLAVGLKPSGIIGGLQAGFNWQMNRNWVLGIETDFQWSGQRDSQTEGESFSTICGDGCTIDGSFSERVESKLSWLGTLRGRIGFVPDTMPRTMFYGTGGLAYGRVKTSLNVSESLLCTGGTCDGEGASAQIFASQSKTKVGFAVGAGVESAFADHWTWKVEYLYVDLGTANGNMAVTASCRSDFAGFCDSIPGSLAYSNKMTDNIIRVGVNYKFGP
jgi:outer membrane immunogenic protein